MNLQILLLGLTLLAKHTTALYLQLLGSQSDTSLVTFRLPIDPDFAASIEFRCRVDGRKRIMTLVQSQVHVGKSPRVVEEVKIVKGDCNLPKFVRIGIGEITNFNCHPERAGAITCVQGERSHDVGRRGGSALRSGSDRRRAPPRPDEEAQQRRRQDDADRRRRDDADRDRQEDVVRRRQQNAVRRGQQNADSRRQEEADHRGQEDDVRRRQQNAVRRGQQNEDSRRQQNAVRRGQQNADRRRQEEADRLFAAQLQYHEDEWAAFRLQQEEEGRLAEQRLEKQRGSGRSGNGGRRGPQAIRQISKEEQESNDWNLALQLQQEENDVGSSAGSQNSKGQSSAQPGYVGWVGAC